MRLYDVFAIFTILLTGPGLAGSIKYASDPYDNPIVIDALEKEIGFVPWDGSCYFFKYSCYAWLDFFAEFECRVWRDEDVIKQSMEKLKMYIVYEKKK